MSSDNKVTWKNYLITGAQSTLFVAGTHLLATYTKCPVAENWTTLAAAGALGSVFGAYTASGGTVKEAVRSGKEFSKSILTRILRPDPTCGK